MRSCLISGRWIIIFLFFFCNKIILFPLVWRFRYLTYFRHHIHLYTVRRVAVNYLILVFRHVGWTLSHSRLFYNHILLKFKNLEDVGVVLKKFLVKILNFLFFSSIIIYLFLLHRVFYIIIILCSGVSKKTAINSRYIFIICYVDPLYLLLYNIYIYIASYRVTAAIICFYN